MNIRRLQTDLLKLYIAIDGVSISNSSTSQLWPIVGFIPIFTNSIPFVIGIYHGFRKPNDSNLFLKELVQEAHGLNEIGFYFKNRCVRVLISVFICDAPARSMISCTKGHSSKKMVEVNVVVQGCG